MSASGNGTAAPPAMPALPALDDTMGALFIGVTIAAALFGVTCVQVYFYFTQYTKDPWYTRGLVAVVFLCDMCHQMLISHSIYHYVITNFAKPEMLYSIPSSLVVEVEINAIVAFLVQGFFVFRIWKLSGGSYYVTAPVAALVCTGFIVSSIYVAHAFKLKSLLQLPEVDTLSKLINVLGAASDVAIAAAMVFLLRRSRTGFERSNNIINRLVLFVVNTGLLTSVCALCSLVAILAAPTKFIYICFFFTLGRLYSNSLLATLNARTSLRSAASTRDEISLNAKNSGNGAYNNTVRSRTLQGLNASKDNSNHGISINIESTTVQHQEDEALKYSGLVGNEAFDRVAYHGKHERV